MVGNKAVCTSLCSPTVSITVETLLNLKFPFFQYNVSYRGSNAYQKIVL
jgi:hypothetical protein